jgi:hypothetical protein
MKLLREPFTVQSLHLVHDSYELGEFGLPGFVKEDELSFDRAILEDMILPTVVTYPSYNLILIFR